ncbi:Histidine kinase 5-like protein 2 [Colletotrichum graminicola]|nr:Histidine kinase 5-like protein 2 [Colletotrichum graminicola]
MFMYQRFRAVLEGHREQETYRYDPSLIAQAIYINMEDLIPPAESRTSPDLALTAFAELAVLRLKTSRALISFFDPDYQYIVVETTPSLPLTPYADFANHEVGEHLVFCDTAVPRVAGIRELAHGISESPPSKSSTGGADVSVTIKPDVAADSKSSQRAFCYVAPENHFFTGVPLRTPNGIGIGVFCVLHTRSHGSQ